MSLEASWISPTAFYCDTLLGNHGSVYVSDTTSYTINKAEHWEIQLLPKWCPNIGPPDADAAATAHSDPDMLEKMYFHGALGREDRRVERRVRKECKREREGRERRVREECKREEGKRGQEIEGKR